MVVSCLFKIIILNVCGGFKIELNIITSILFFRKLLIICLFHNGYFKPLFFV